MRVIERSLNCSGVQKGTTDIPNLVPRIDTGIMAQIIATKVEKNFTVRTVSAKASERETRARTQLTMYLCLLLHLFTTNARVNMR